MGSPDAYAGYTKAIADLAADLAGRNANEALDDPIAVAAAQKSATEGVRAAWQHINNLQARAAETFAGTGPGGWGMTIAAGMGYVNDAFEIAWAYKTGELHGWAMIANAATFHLIRPLDSYVDGLIENNGGAYGVANFSAHVGVYAAEAAALLSVAGALPQFTVIVGEGSPFHVIYQAGAQSRFLHASGTVIGRMKVVSMTGAQVSAFEAVSYLTMRLPILFPAAAGGLQGERAYSCITNAAHAFLRGWMPFV